MYRFLKFAVVMALIVAVPSCGLLDLFRAKETGLSELKAFTSEQELLDYIEGQITRQNESRWRAGGFPTPGGAFDGDAPMDSSGGQGAGSEGPEDNGSGRNELGFSETTTQETGVDEADVVKTDGDYLYIIDDFYSGTSILRIVRIAPPDQPLLVSETELNGYGREIYLHDGKVVAMTSSGGGYFTIGVRVDPEVNVADVAVELEPIPVDGGTGDIGSSGSAGDVDEETTPDEDPGAAEDIEYVYQRPQTIVTILDVSKPGSPLLLSETKFDGMQSSSRMINGVLHMVLANYQTDYIDEYPILGEQDLDVSSVDVSALLPGFERVGQEGAAASGNVVTYKELYHPVDPDGYGVVTLVSLDVDDDAEFTAVGVVAEPGLIYSSLEAMYLTDTQYDWQQATRTTTDIYKFTYVGRGAEPTATGSVPGRILNQYSMGEYNGYLRVATTTDRSVTLLGETTQSGNNVYVLGQAEETDALTIVGKVEGIARGETITSARFAGDRGYVVTFEQIDPLHTLDLSNPANPWVVGELEVPGFSTYLVPIDANNLLAIGRYIPPPGQSGSWGVQLSIFDVTDFSNPVQRTPIIIGDSGGADSEALWNPKAFTYWAEGGLAAIPVSMYGGLLDGVFVEDATDIVDVDSDTVWQWQRFEGLYVFSVSAEDGLTQLGQISTRPEDTDYYYPSFSRGVFIGDKVYAVTDKGVRGAPVSNVSSVDEELFFDEATSGQLPPGILDLLFPEEEVGAGSTGG